MHRNFFFPSSTLDNIRLNVIVLHALALIFGGIYVIYAVLQHDEISIKTQLPIGLITLAFGFFNIFAAKFRSFLLITISLLIWFSVLIYQSFSVIDPTKAAIGINMALLSLIVLITIYYNARAGLGMLILVTAFNFYRLYALEKGFINPQIASNTGIFETNVLAILSVYSCAIAGYYQYQSQRFLDALKRKKESLIDAVAELRAKESALITIINEIQHLSSEKLPLIKPNIHNCLEKLNSKDDQDFNQFLTTADSSMKYIDEVLRSIDNQIKAYELD